MALLTTALASTVQGFKRQQGLQRRWAVVMHEAVLRRENDRQLTQTAY